MKARLTYLFDCNGAYPVVLWACMGCVFVWAKVGQFKPIRVIYF